MEPAEVPKSPKEKSPKKQRLLFFLNDPMILKAIIPSLIRFEYEIAFARTIVEFSEKIHSFNPSVILISWSLPHFNIKDLFSLLCDRLNAVVLVFCEDNNPTQLMSFNNSGIAQTIFPPLSAQGIHQRIIKMIKEKIERVVMLKEQGDDFGATTIPIADINQELEWQQVNAAKSSLVEYNGQVWRTKLPGNADTVYYYVGLKAPKFDVASKTWDAALEGKLLLKVPSTDLRLISVLECRPAIREMSATGSLPDPNDLNLTADMSVIEKFVRTVLHWRGFAIDPVPAPLPVLTNLTAAILNGPEIKGYLLCTNSIDCFDPDLLKKVCNDLERQMNRFVEHIKPVGEPMLLNFKADVLGKILSEWCTFRVSYPHGGHVTSFMFISEAKMPDISLYAIKNYMALPVGELVADTTLDFDLYLNLPSNGKFILYLKKGSEISGKTIDKFNAFGCKNIYFAKEDRDAVYAYQSKNEIARLATKERRAKS